MCTARSGRERTADRTTVGSLHVERIMDAYPWRRKIVDLKQNSGNTRKLSPYR